jgi:hypothetical protein
VIFISLFLSLRPGGGTEALRRQGRQRHHTCDIAAHRNLGASRRKDVWLPGDDLFGSDDANLREVVRPAAASEPEGADLVVATDGITPADIAARITTLWPSSLPS